MSLIKYRHRKTGTVYKKVIFFDHAPLLAQVTTEAGSTYIVRRGAIEAVKSSQIKKAVK